MSSTARRTAPLPAGESLEKAVEFLLRNRRADGCWTDFWTPAGTSDEWVSGFVGSMLATAPLDAARRAARECWQLLECRRYDAGGWGYHDEVPADADSTQWVLSLAGALDAPRTQRIVEAEAFLERHAVGGGVTTYAEAAPIRAYLGLPDAISFEGWTGPHSCVAAALAHHPAWRARLGPYLLGTQLPDGSWPAYWWIGDEYVTALAATALDAVRNEAAARAVDRACAWAEQRAEALLRSGGDPSPFALAWLLHALALRPSRAERASEVAQALVALQRPDGSFHGTARLRVPAPPVVDPTSVPTYDRWFGLAPAETVQQKLENTFNVFSTDQAGNFTTASVVGALAKWSRFDAHPRTTTAISAPPGVEFERTVSVDVRQVEALHRDGFVVLRRVFEPDEIAWLRRRLVAAARRGEPQAGRPHADREALDRVEGLWCVDDAARSLALSPRLGRIAADLLDVGCVRLLLDQAFFKHPGAARTPWHQDLYFWPLDTDRLVTLWLSLTGSTPARGGLRFITRSHRAHSAGAMDAMNRSDAELDRRMHAFGGTIVELDPLQPGDVSAHLGWTVHGAGPNDTDRDRLALAVAYYADGTRLRHIAPVSSTSPYDHYAARAQLATRDRWLPNRGAGDPAVTAMNPMAHARA